MSANPPGQAARSEVAAQSAFLAALFRQSAAIQGATALHADSLQAYRGNLAASVERALGAIYPSVLQRLGSDDFDALAQLYLAAHPPQRGDWAQYGELFPHWLRTHNPGGVVAALPYLPDLATFDAAMHRAEAALDAALDASSLQALAGGAAHVRVLLHPSVAVIDCEYRVHGILHDAHTEPKAEPQPYLIWRSGWRAQHRCAPASEAAFVRFCLGGATIEQALAAANTLATFDFESWLMAALQEGLIVGLQAD